MGSVQDGGDIPLTPTSTLDAVRAVLEQCRSEMIKGIEGSNLQGFSREQRWLMLKGEEALLTLQEVMPTGAMRFFDYEHKDTPLFSFSVIYVVNCTCYKKIIDVFTPEDVTLLAHTWRDSRVSWLLGRARNRLKDRQPSQTDGVKCYITCSRLAARDSNEFNVTQTLKILGSKALKVPTMQSLADASAIAFLFLMKLRYGLGIPDLCGLLSALVPQPGNKFVEESMLAPPPEDEWRSAKSLNPGKIQTSTSSTKVMLFPGPHPQAHTKHMWMERHKPHGRRPVSTSKVAIWGSWSQNQTGWSCLIAFSNIEAATVYSDRLSSVLSGSNAQMIDKLTKHWVRACYYICRLGLNDASLRLVDISEAIDNLRYLNAATPKPGGALACLMYMNQLEYQKRLVDFLSASLGKFPTNWDIVQKPGWTKDMAKKCRLLSSNIDKVYEEASKQRNLVIEHYGLAQSRNLGFLTILASFFVPITAVSGFFGMNTTEINGGTWPTKYFGIVAGSLTFVSVLLPLVVLSLIDAVLRFLSQDILRHFFASVILLVALAANIHLVILYNADWSLGIQIWFAVGRLVMPVITVAQYVTIDLTLPIIRAIQVRRRRDQDLGSTAFSVAEAMKEAPLERKWRLAVFTVLTVVYFIGYFVNAHTSIVAMGLYYVYVGVAWYWHRRRSKRSME